MPPQEKDPVNPPCMKDGEFRAAFCYFDQDMTKKSQALSTHAQAMVAQENRDVGPHVQHNGSTTTSRLRDFNRMNPPIFFASKVNEDP